MAPFLRAVHGGRPRVLREDFCGTGGVCRAWAAMPSAPSRPFRAIGVDIDGELVKRLRGIPNVRAVRADVRDCDLRADIISATNFSIGYWHTRKDLVRYLGLCRERLKTGGVFVCDTYGGATAFSRGTLTRDVWIENGVRIRYTWEQRLANPLTGRVLDALHFRVDRDGEVLFQEHDAFVYEWRLWSVPELRDAFADARFGTVEAYAQLADAVDSEGGLYVRPVDDPEELEDSFVVLLAARPR
jgi:SAM-dependent methyltransferase